jgi:hypothetical protein
MRKVSKRREQTESAKRESSTGAAESFHDRKSRLATLAFPLDSTPAAQRLVAAGSRRDVPVQSRQTYRVSRPS